ncbi:MAG: UDP-N-acetylglucosamine 1-carboxyvinyltransferase [Candidatus Aminicenantes bacterium]|nr:MAG: UDP-N-acetylglucosamine 1-carboxyvinyltransferase [Candidatus Aminicenantes bacterium]
MADLKNTKIVINGKHQLSGRVRIAGAKNAALPELAAVVLSSGEFYFRDVPGVEDIKVMFHALENLGAEGEFRSNTIQIKIPVIKSPLVPKEIVETSRASILLLGPLVARYGYAKVSTPGGCAIGDRKINFHLEGLGKMGTEIKEEDEHIVAKTHKPLQAIDYTFPAKTVTGTENLLMAAVLAEGTTVLRNCALEPEIGDLIELLLAMGADIKGKNSETLTITGKSSLNGAVHQIIPDRIEMGTYVIAGCFGGNEIVIENAVPEYVGCLLEVLEQVGVQVKTGKDTITVSSNGAFQPVELETMPYPGYPTDLQAQLTTLLTQAEGTSRIRENIFNNRFQHTKELNKMGANIEVKGDTSIIKGKTPLVGKMIRATDLRASAALVLGGLIAEGKTTIENVFQLFRGYENMPQKLRLLGADVKLIED